MMVGLIGNIAENGIQGNNDSPTAPKRGSAADSKLAECLASYKTGTWQLTVDQKARGS
jgi:hypothetical protein